MSRSVICIAPTLERADVIIEELKRHGFTADDISVLFPDKHSTHSFAHRVATKAPEGATAGVGVGGVVGGALGLLAGIGLLVIPGAGPFIAAGPIMGALSGAAVGGTLGGITGALVGLGIPEMEARRYEDSVKDGNILLSVHLEYPDDAVRASDVFHRHGASRVCVAEETPAPDAESAAPASVDRSTEVSE